MRVARSYLPRARRAHTATAHTATARCAAASKFIIHLPPQQRTARARAARAYITRARFFFYLSRAALTIFFARVPLCPFFGSARHCCDRIIRHGATAFPSARAYAAFLPSCAAAIVRAAFAPAAAYAARAALFRCFRACVAFACCRWLVNTRGARCCQAFIGAAVASWIIPCFCRQYSARYLSGGSWASRPRMEQYQRRTAATLARNPCACSITISRRSSFRHFNKLFRAVRA